MRFFDFEVFPNWWLCVFGDMPEDTKNITEQCKKDFYYVSSDMPDCRDLLIQYLKEDGYILAGYNVKGYDLVIANAIYQGFTPQQVKIVNDMIINPGTMWSSREHIRLQPFVRKRLSGISYQDLMDDSTGSLKEKESVLGLSVLESSIPFDKEDLTEDDKVDIILYCKQDVYAAMMFYVKVVTPYTMSKLALGTKFNISEKTCRASTNANLVSIVLNAKKTEFADAEKIEIELPDKIKPYCYENVPSKILEKLLTSNESFTAKVFNNDVSYGNGGIHSVLRNTLYVESNDEWVLLNVDATSYYPSMLIQFDCLSRCSQTPEVFSYIYNERIRIKHLEHKTDEDEANQLAYKLVLNTTFGASGNQYIGLYDPHMCTRTCRLGQIFLTALACKLVDSVPSLSIIQTNTDGILVYVRRKYMDKVDACMKEWTNVSGISMEKDEVIKIWQRNVNNYMLLEYDKGKVVRKVRGAWLRDTYLRPGYVTIGTLNSYVCTRAVQNYLIDGTDILKSIVLNNNVEDFVMTCTKGPSYRGVVHRMADGTEVPCYKNNRVYASKDTSLGKLYKYKVRLGKTSYTMMSDTPDYCRTINEDLSTYKFEDIKKDLDYMYYVRKAISLLDTAVTDEPWADFDGLDFIKSKRFDYLD